MLTLLPSGLSDLGCCHIPGTLSRLGPKAGPCRCVGAGDDVTAKDPLGPGVPGPLCMGPQSPDPGGPPMAKERLVHPKDGGPQPVIGPWVPLAPIRSVSGHPTPFVAACLSG